MTSTSSFQTKSSCNMKIRSLLHSFSVGDFNRRYREDEEFRPFAEKVYRYFDNMRPGMCLKLSSYDDRKLEWILLTFVAYYFEGGHFLEYAISEDYTYIVRENMSEAERNVLYESWRKNRHRS